MSVGIPTTINEMVKATIENQRQNQKSEKFVKTKTYEADRLKLSKVDEYNNLDCLDQTLQKNRIESVKSSKIAKEAKEREEKKRHCLVYLEELLEYLTELLRENERLLNRTPIVDIKTFDPNPELYTIMSDIPMLKRRIKDISERTLPGAIKELHAATRASKVAAEAAKKAKSTVDDLIEKVAQSEKNYSEAAEKCEFVKCQIKKAQEVSAKANSKYQYLFASFLEKNKIETKILTTVHIAYVISKMFADLRKEREDAADLEIRYMITRISLYHLFYPLDANFDSIKGIREIRLRFLSHLSRSLGGFNSLAILAHHYNKNFKIERLLELEHDSLLAFANGFLVEDEDMIKPDVKKLSKLLNIASFVNCLPMVYTILDMADQYNASL